MTDLDTERPHVVTSPHNVHYTATWIGFCTCGAEFMGTEEDVRAAGQPHRDAERVRFAQADWERDEARRLRREARREQRRSKAVHSGGKGRGVR